MRLIVVVALVSLAGCSWMSVRSRNDPRVGCSATVARVDAGAAIVGLVGIAALITNIALDPPTEGDHAGTRRMTGFASGILLITSTTYALSAGYGFGVANRCEADRKRLYAGAPGANP